MAPRRLQIERILCPTDFSEFSTSALDRAVRLAGWFGARVTALRVMPQVPWSLPGPVGGSYLGMPADLLRSQRSEEAKALEEAVAPFRNEGVVIETELREGEPSREIEVVAEALPADLLVMGTHGRSGFEHLLLGSVTEKVLRRVPCPVLTVGKAAAHGEGGALFRRILCAVDLTDSSRGTIDMALSLAEENMAKVTLLHVVEGLPGAVGPSLYRGLPDISELRNELAKEADARLCRALSDAPPNFCSVSERVREGVPWSEVLRAAKETDADLIVMGAHSRGALDRMFFGSTANQVVRQAACPVLVVRRLQARARKAEEATLGACTLVAAAEGGR